MKTEVKHYSDIKFLHCPTGKIYVCNGAGGITCEGSNVAFPLWLTEYSLDWVRINNNEEKEAIVKGNLFLAAPKMFKALKRVEAYLVENEDILAPFPTRSELDNIRAIIDEI